MTKWRWPVLFRLPSVRRELNFHHAIAEFGVQRAIVATATAEYADGSGLSPAENVWWLHGRQGERIRLSDLPHVNPKTPKASLDKEYG